MHSVFGVLHSVSPAIADLVVASVWQSLLLTGIVALCLRLIPGLPAGTRSGLWTALLVLILLLPAITVLVPHTGAAEGHAVHLENRWSLGLACLWAMLSLFRAAQLCLSAFRLRTLVKNSTPVEPDPTIAPLLKTGSRRVLLCTSQQIDRPGLVGFFHPRILLRPELLESLPQPELEQIVLHEMEHLRRRDDWANLLQLVCLMLLPWNPAVLWVNRRLCLECELACDDAVLRATTARKAYAACLVRLAEDSMLRRSISLALGALGRFERSARESDLLKRVRRILTVPELGNKPRFLRTATTAVLFVALSGSVLLARSPLLVDFGPGQATLAAAAPSDASALPVGQMASARPTLVKAIMPGTTNLRPALATPVTLQKRPAVRHRAPRPVTGRAYTTSIPIWHSATPLPRAVITLTSVQSSQRLYAAVPWQGGWLLIQL